MASPSNKLSSTAGAISTPVIRTASQSLAPILKIENVDYSYEDDPTALDNDRALYTIPQAPPIEQQSIPSPIRPLYTIGQEGTYPSPFQPSTQPYRSKHHLRQSSTPVASIHAGRRSRNLHPSHGVRKMRSLDSSYSGTPGLSKASSSVYSASSPSASRPSLAQFNPTLSHRPSHSSLSPTLSTRSSVLFHDVSPSRVSANGRPHANRPEIEVDRPSPVASTEPNDGHNSGKSLPSRRRFRWLFSRPRKHTVDVDSKGNASKDPQKENKRQSLFRILGLRKDAKPAPEFPEELFSAAREARSALPENFDKRMAVPPPVITRGRGRSASAASALSEARASCGRKSEFSSACNSTEFLPDLTGEIERETSSAVAGGGHADVWKGVWHSTQRDYDVAIKAIRIYLADGEDKKQKKDRRLRHEIKVWVDLDHPNVLPLFGVAYDFGPFAAMVCPWQDKGNLNTYLHQHHKTLNFSARTRILHQISNGLKYLHSHTVMHGDLTGSNVMVSADDNCTLSDFGLSALLEDMDIGSGSSSIRGAIRWAAPELYRPDFDNTAPRRSFYNDIYSLGSMVLQVLSGRIPYYQDNELRVLGKIVTGVLPGIPPDTHVPSHYNDLMKRCWALNPHDRPIIDQVVLYLRHLHAHHFYSSDRLEVQALSWEEFHATPET